MTNFINGKSDVAIYSEDELRRFCAKARKAGLRWYCGRPFVIGFPMYVSNSVYGMAGSLYPPTSAWGMQVVRVRDLSMARLTEES